MKIILCCLLTAFVVHVTAQNYAIGHRKINYTDASRNNRTVALEVYYPASTAGENMPVINNNKKFPLVIFGHGYQLTYSDYLWLKDSLVPQGFFIAFPRTEEVLFPSHTDFAKDIAFSVDAFKIDNNNASSWFYKRLLGRNIVSGHSMGGGCSLLSIRYSNNISGVFNFAAAETNPSAIAASASINLPALIFSGGKDCVCPSATNQLPMYNSVMPFCKTFVKITKAKHCHWSNNGSCSLGELTCGQLTTPAKPTLSTTFSLLLPWLQAVSYNNDIYKQQFQQLLTSLTTITYQQNCGGINSVKESIAINKEEKLKVYPSFLKQGEALHIQIPLNVSTSFLQIINQQGKVIITQQSNAASVFYTINTTGLQHGIYFISITPNGIIYKSRFVIE